MLTILQSSLGSLVEICVKLTKQLISKSIKNNVLDYFDFAFLISQTESLVNKRPILFKAGLRDVSESVPQCITPEMIIKGYETAILNIVPNLQECDVDGDYEPSPNCLKKYQSLSKVRSNLLEIYHSEFLVNLIDQAVDKSDRYKKVNHSIIKPGDIVLLAEKHVKRGHFPMGRVHKVEVNSLGEVTAAHVFKGSTKELVYRHSSTLIPLISVDGFQETTAVAKSTENLSSVNLPVKRKPRQAAVRCKKKMKSLLSG